MDRFSKDPKDAPNRVEAGIGAPWGKFGRWACPAGGLPLDRNHNVHMLQRPPRWMLGYCVRWPVPPIARASPLASSPGRGPRALHGRGPCGKLQWSRAGEWAIIFQGRALPRTDRGPSDGSPRGRLPRRLRERPRRPRRGGPRGPRLGGGAAGRQGSGAAAPGRWQSDPFRAPPLRATPPPRAS